MVIRARRVPVSFASAGRLEDWMVGLCPVFQFSGWTPVRTWAEQASWAVLYSRFSNEINLVELLHRVYNEEEDYEDRSDSCVSRACNCRFHKSLSDGTREGTVGPVPLSGYALTNDCWLHFSTSSPVYVHDASNSRCRPGSFPDGEANPSTNDG
jgi:hypothetical protein